MSFIGYKGLSSIHLPKNLANSTVLSEMPVIGNQRTDQRAIQLLRAARTIFLNSGWDYFGMEYIAEFAERSRPLVYRHFSCEEILLALAIEGNTAPRT